MFEEQGFQSIPIEKIVPSNELTGVDLAVIEAEVEAVEAKVEKKSGKKAKKQEEAA